MKKSIEKLINVVKLQVDAFLLDANEFYPFGTYINNEGDIVPIGVYLGDDYPSSLEIIDSLKDNFNRQIQNGNCEIAAIAINVSVNENNKTFDAVKVMIFKANREVETIYLKYVVRKSSVEYFDN